MILASLTPAAGAGDPDAFVAAYQKKISQAKGVAADETVALLADLLSYDGILPDEAVYSYLDFVKDVCIYLEDEHWSDPGVYESLREDSIISVREGEGGVGYWLNYIAIRAALGGKLSAAYDTFLALMGQYLSGYLIDDMALMISWDELAQFLVDWSVFQQNYPDFVEIESVASDLRFGLYLYAGCFNLDNTPVILHDIMLAQEVQESYAKFLGDPKNSACVYYSEIEALFAVWQDNEFVYTQAVKDFIHELDVQLYGEESIEE